MTPAARPTLFAAMFAKLLAAFHPLTQRWAALSARERQGLRLAGLAVGLALLWVLGIAPVWRTWREVPAQAAALETQWLKMQADAAEARELKTTPAISPAEATAALKTTVERLGAHATLSLVGERATLTLTELNTEQWATLLAELRQGVRARPLELQLSQGDKGWNGQLILSLPANPV